MIYALSFIVLGTYWIAHHSQTRPEGSWELSPGFSRASAWVTHSKCVLPSQGT